MIGAQTSPVLPQPPAPLVLTRMASPSEVREFAPAGAERRAHPRLTAAELSWLNHARLKYGPPVSLIDLSRGGAQIETTSHRLQPGSTVVIELGVGTRSLAVSAEVLRCRIAGLNPQVWYRSALVFKRPFDFPDPPSGDGSDAGCNPAHEYARLRALAQGAGRGDGTQMPAGVRALDAAFAMIESARENGPGAPFVREMGGLLKLIANSLESGSGTDAIVEEMLEQLRRTIPSSTVHLMEIDDVSRIGDHAVSFPIPSTDKRAAARLVVEFSDEGSLKAWHLQFVEGAAELIGVARSFDTVVQAHNSSSAPERSIDQSVEALNLLGWHRLVVRYLDGRLLKGYGCGFRPSKGHLHLWSEPGAAADSTMTIPLAQLKAAFFVHDSVGGAPEAAPAAAVSRKVTVTFVDGEVLQGTTTGYSQNGPGFFVSPIDRQTSNVRMFVAAGAIRHVQLS